MLVEVIQDDKVLQTVQHCGQTYCVVPKTGPYQIRVTNNHPCRRLAVVAVDGVNINDGSTANPDGSGYVLDAFRSVTLKGWLRSNNEVAAFEFSDSKESYSAETGRGEKNTGIIGVAVFDERVKPIILEKTTYIQVPVPYVIPQPFWPHSPPWNPWRGPMWTCDTGAIGSTLSSAVPSNSTSGALFDSGTEDGPMRGGPSTASAPRSKGGVRRRSASPETNLGTAYGAREVQHTAQTTFERATRVPVAVIELRYATKAKLKSWGVKFDRKKSKNPAPVAFPAATGFAQPPPGWRG